MYTTDWKETERRYLDHSMETNFAEELAHLGSLGWEKESKSRELRRHSKQHNNSPEWE